MKRFRRPRSRSHLAPPGGSLRRVAGLLIGGGLLLGAGIVPDADAAPPVLPVEQAVDQSRKAASAVLARSGDEACLRGKLTNALLRLSASCKAAAEGGELCALAKQAAVVTPMTLRFMDETSRSLLELTSP